MPPAAYPYDHTMVQATIARYLPHWRQASFDAVVAIARGGLIPATLIASDLGLPLMALSYQRASREVQWFSRAQTAPGCRILLVEDIAGRGHTLDDCLAFLRARQCDVSVFTLAYDDESRIRPDYGRYIPSGYRAWFAWERETITDAFSATQNLPELAQHDYAAWAIDLDGILLPDIPAHHYAADLQATLAQRDRLVPAEPLPALKQLRQLPIITGRPESDRARTQAWLHHYGFSGPLFMRDSRTHSAEQTAAHKAQALLENRYTHFLESEAAQALDIALLTQHAAIYWWNGSRALQIHASQALFA